MLRPLFRMVASTRSRDLFIAAVLFVVIAAGVITNQAGMSMALGAFVAGLLLAETEYRRAVEATIDPFKSLLLGIFFFTVGMDIDVRALLREPLLLAAGVVGLIALKSSVLIVLAKLFRLSWPVTVEMGLLLGAGGEFAFVSLTMAAASKLIDSRTTTFALTVTAVTMALIPLLSHLARRFASRLRASTPPAGAAPEATRHARPRPPRNPAASDPGRATSGRPGLRGAGGGAHLRPRPQALRTAGGVRCGPLN